MHDAARGPRDWDRATLAGVSFSWRCGCREHPSPPDTWALLTERAATLVGDVLDASACLGVPARAATDARTTVLEPSAVGLEALRRDLGDPAAEASPASGSPAGGRAEGGTATPRVAAGLPWDAPAGAFDHVLLAPPAERGSARVRAELAAAARALRPDGRAWVALHKDRGAKRYERDATRWFAKVEVLARRKGARLARLTGPRGEADADPWRRFDTPVGPAWALAGCYAAGKLDPGSARLLDALAAHGAIASAADVLDLGCGWGPLARAAADRGASVVASDDDLAAVRSCARTVPEAEVVHADADRGLDPRRVFDRVLLNPPFHVGAGVRLDLARALLRAARRRTAPGGETWLVANAQLPYEGAFEPGDAVTEIAREGGFKVLRVRPRSGR